MSLVSPAALVGIGCFKREHQSKHNSLVVVSQHAILRVQTHSFGQHAPLDIAPFTHQVAGSIAVVAMDDILRDDRAFVESVGDIVSCSADELDAALKRLLIGIGTNEGW